MVDFLKDLQKGKEEARSLKDIRSGKVQDRDPVRSGSKAPSISATKGAPVYFFSEFPNLGFIHKKTGKQVKFQGNYYYTENPQLAQYINKHHGHQATEITKEMYEDGTTLVSAPEKPAKSEFFTNKMGSTT